MGRSFAGIVLPVGIRDEVTAVFYATRVIGVADRADQRQFALHIATRTEIDMTRNASTLRAYATQFVRLPAGRDKR